MTSEVQFTTSHGSPGVYSARIVSTGEYVWAATANTYRIINGSMNSNPPQIAEVVASIRDQDLISELNEAAKLEADNWGWV